MRDHPPAKDWARRAEQRFQETVAREVAAHLDAGRPVYYQSGRKIYALHPDGSSRQVRTVPAGAKRVKGRPPRR